MINPKTPINSCVHGSFPHILLNKNLDTQAKVATLREKTVECAKDTFAYGATVAGIGGTAALAYAKSPKVAGFMNEVKEKIAHSLSSVSVNGTNLKDMIKNNKIFDKFNKLPSPAKVAIAVGSAALAMTAPCFALIQSRKKGYIEGKHEADTLKRNTAQMLLQAKKSVAYQDNTKMGCVAKQCVA